MIFTVFDNLLAKNKRELITYCRGWYGEEMGRVNRIFK